MKRHSPTGHPVELPDPKKMSFVPSLRLLDFCGDSHRVMDAVVRSSGDETTTAAEEVTATAVTRAEDDNTTTAAI